jgi:hypothetical protein
MGSWVGPDCKVIDEVGGIGRHVFDTSIMNISTSLVRSPSTYFWLRPVMT